MLEIQYYRKEEEGKKIHRNYLKTTMTTTKNIYMAFALKIRSFKKIIVVYKNKN